ncbi:hypothetical protein OOK13_00140 [Streptomyces sp. NBC_00378]|uniref:hypothetical protein n=1 Tax=unclassified Streptomyces TaxID=2593676 RepID=UPI00224DAB15|nr:MULTISPECIES: hypothetical protein [unclassified Streptomyces]MCX5107022.1 hypothetical protein [Streptomyces sp. NBC_00378]
MPHQHRRRARIAFSESAGPRLREYADEVEHVRLLYWVSALGTTVVVAYIEV